MKEGTLFYKISKRTIDIIISMSVIILFSPVFIITAILIKMDGTGGPILADMPKRVGKNYKMFFMYKFRSMVPNAHAYMMNHPELYEKYKRQNHKLSVEEDTRITKIGRRIRKTSIDEFPQFFNVLKGEMSFVGPRAYFKQELEDHMQHYPQTKKLIRQALTVKPGITGPWQVGGRNELNFSQRIRLDADYASRKSLWFDIKIILKTPYAVLFQRGVK